MDVNLLMIYRKKRKARKLFLCSLLRERHVRQKFHLSFITDEKCLFLFRFKNADIVTLRHLFRIPSTLKGINGTMYDGLEGKCIVINMALGSLKNHSKIIFICSSLRTSAEISLSKSLGRYVSVILSVQGSTQCYCKYDS